MIQNIGRFSFQKKWLVISVWLVVVVGLNFLASQKGTNFRMEFNDLDFESVKGGDIIAEEFPEQLSLRSAPIVFRVQPEEVDSPTTFAQVESLTRVVDGVDGFNAANPYLSFPPRVSPKGIGVIQVLIEDSVEEAEVEQLAMELRDQLADGNRPTEIGDLEFYLGGAYLAEFDPPETEAIGVAFAIVILVLAFGSVVAMGLPIGTALAGVAAGMATTTLLSHWLMVAEWVPMIGMMIALGAGIDYALFIVNRMRELKREGKDNESALVQAMSTSGRAVVFAGLTVVLSLLGMLVIGLDFVNGLAVTASATVGFTMIASITLLPALIGVVGDKIEVTRTRGLLASAFFAVSMLAYGLASVVSDGLKTVAMIAAVCGLLVLVAGIVVQLVSKDGGNRLLSVIPARKPKPMEETFAYRWSHLIQDRPWVFAIAGLAVLLLMSAPTLGLRLGFSDESNFPEGSDTRIAYDLSAEAFGAGSNGPLLIVGRLDSLEQTEAVASMVAVLNPSVELSDVDSDGNVDAIKDIRSAIATTTIRALPKTETELEASNAFVVQVIPRSGPQSEETEQLVYDIRNHVTSNLGELSDMTYVTGAVPTNHDFSEFLAGRSVWFFGAVLLVSFLLLMVVFRSVLVPIKAVVMNMLSISAAFGAVVMIFQWGWFGSITGLEPAPIESFLPMMLFAIVFGLSMDYEVFLLSRIRENYHETGDSKEAVSAGLALTARVITAAALIMFVVFGSFLLEENRVIKLFGTGLAFAIILDATLVRMLLVPATMRLLGDKNWWLPRWLDRVLPNVSVEG